MTLHWSHIHDAQGKLLSAFDRFSFEEQWAAAVQGPGGPDPDLHECIWSGTLTGK